MTTGRTLLVGLLLGSCWAQTADSGHLVLVGGGSEPEAALRLVVELSEAAGGALLVLPLATTRPESGPAYQKLFDEYGASEVRVLALTRREDAFLPEVLAALQSAGGVWFTGGSQRRITERIAGTPVQEALRELLARGGVVAGTSAGTACQGSLMLTGRGDLDLLEADNVELVPGLELVPGVVFDQHFIARGRQARLLSAVLEHPELVGIGIDEGTAVHWTAGGLLVIGRGHVLIYDGRGAETGDDAGRLWGRELRLHALSAGQRWHE